MDVNRLRDLIRAADAKSQHDVFDLLVYWSLEQLGLQPAGELQRNGRPAGWAPGIEDAAELRFRHASDPKKSLLVKLVRADSSMIVSISVGDSDQNETLELPLSTYLREGAALGDPDSVLKLDFASLATELAPAVARVMPPPSRGARSSSSNDDDRLSSGDSRSSGRARGPAAPESVPNPLLIGHFHPGHERSPYTVGDRDLDPLAAMGPPGPGGGMLVGPGHPMFQGRGFGPHNPLRPSGVPPGARYDPTSPIPPNRFGGEPDFDHMRPPGYGDMFF
eukprot:m.45115 g.45115  ORF g.45115 m.45115 type:complete len:278 (-) comp6229_c0_seq1:1265-2098(-)